MAAPRRDQKLPNYKFFMEKEKPVFVIPVLYHGRMVGHGNYMAGRRADNQEMITDKIGRPIPYKQIDLPNWQN